MPYYHQCEEKVEDAFAAALLTEYGGTLTGVAISGGALDGHNIYKGFSIADVAPPMITVICSGCTTREGRGSEGIGNLLCTLQVTVAHHRADTTRAAHAETVAVVRDFAYASNLVALMNAEGVAEFVAQRAYCAGSTRQVQDGMIATTVAVEIMCRPSAA